MWHKNELCGKPIWLRAMFLQKNEAFSKFVDHIYKEKAVYTFITTRNRQSENCWYTMKMSFKRFASEYREKTFPGNIKTFSLKYRT